MYKRPKDIIYVTQTYHRFPSSSLLPAVSSTVATSCISASAFHTSGGGSFPSLLSVRCPTRTETVESSLCASSGSLVALRQVLEIGRSREVETRAPPLEDLWWGVRSKGNGRRDTTPPSSTGVFFGVMGGEGDAAGGEGGIVGGEGDITGVAEVVGGVVGVSERFLLFAPVMVATFSASKEKPLENAPPIRLENDFWLVIEISELLLGEIVLANQFGGRGKIPTGQF
mmetsp:Transcript_35338/g.81894  ORF Transcript_35338/g.81894 Transcript_35338/m.81894 type:complete len:227 (+) Transcript_35338:191-871(+)